MALDDWDWRQPFLLEEHHCLLIRIKCRELILQLSSRPGAAAATTTAAVTEEAAAAVGVTEADATAVN